MKKLITILGSILFGSFILTSCGGNDKKTLSVDKANINGDTKEYIDVLPGSYEIKKSNGTFGEELSLAIKFKVIKLYDQNKIDDNTGIGNLNLQITDENGTPIDLSFSPSGVGDWAKINSLLKAKIGDEVIVVFKSSSMDVTKEKITGIMKNGKGLEINRADVTNPKSEVKTYNSTSSGEGSAANCDDYLSEYETFINNYIALLKKYNKNPADASILSDYTSMSQQAAAWSAKTADCAADKKFASKYAKITTKVTNAMSGM